MKGNVTVVVKNGKEKVVSPDQEKSERNRACEIFFMCKQENTES